MKTNEQREADLELEAALMRVSRAYSDVQEAQGVLGDWICVTAETRMGAESDEDETYYTIAMSGGGIPDYRAFGLLDIGARMISNHGMERRE